MNRVVEVKNKSCFLLEKLTKARMNIPSLFILFILWSSPDRWIARINKKISCNTYRV